MRSRSNHRLFGRRVRKGRAHGLFVERLEDRVVLDAGPLADSSPLDTASNIATVSTSIHVDLPKGGDSLLPDDSPADDFSLGGSAADTATMSLHSFSDSSLPFTQFARLEMPTAPGNPWDINLSLNPTAGLSKGDVLYVSFYARGERLDLGDAVEAKAYIQERATNTKLLTIPVAASSSWERFSAKIHVEADLSPGEYQFVLHAGFAPQKIDIGGLVIQNYGRLGHRLADYTVTVQDRHGQPLPEATLDIEMVRHGFKFGTQVRDHLFAVSEAEFNAMSDTQKTALTPNLEASFGIPRFVPTWQDIVNHRTIVRENFNHVVPTTGLQWIALENKGSSIPHAAIQEAAAGEQTVTAASVVWQKDRWPTPEAYRSTSSPDPQAFHDALVAARLGGSSVLHQFSDAGSGPTINDWKLLNEPLHENYYQQVFVDAGIYSSEVEALADYFKLADAVRPDATLSINEYNVINSANDNFAIQYRDLVQSLLDAGAPIDRIGVQAHISRNDISKEDIVRRLDLLAETGLPIEISEFYTRDDAATPQLNEAEQEQMFRDILEASFEHPSVDGFILWGIWDKVHWRGNAPLYDANWNIKPEAAAWFDLVRDEWQPNITGQPVGRDGRWDAPIGLYHGTYEITAEANGVSSATTVTISDDSSIVITVDTEAAVDPSVIIASGSSLTETELRAGYLYGDGGIMYVSFDSSLSAEHEAWWHEVLADVDQIIEPEFAIVPPSSSLSQLTIYQLGADSTSANPAGVYIGPSAVVHSDGTVERTSEARIELTEAAYSHLTRFAGSDEAGWKSVAYHELGHALGLEHPHDADDGDVDTEIDTNDTVMSYNQVVDEDGDPGFTLLDVEALASIHGGEAGLTSTPAEGILLLDLGPFDTTQTWKTPSLRMEWVDGSFAQEPVAGTVSKTLELTRYDGFTGSAATVFLDWARDESELNWHWGDEFAPTPGFHDLSFGGSYPSQIDFAADQISATVEIAVIGDTVEEGSEWLDVTARESRSPGYFQAIPTEAVRLTVLDAEERPALDAIGNLFLSQDDETQVVLLSGIAPGVDESQELRVTAISSDTTLVPHPIVTYTSPDTTGSLSLTTSANQHGAATITVTVEDGGADGDLETVADNTSVSRTFEVTIEQVNHQPTLNAITSITIQEGAVQQVVALAGISAGDGETQDLRVTATSSDASLIPDPTVTYASPETTGSIAFTPVADQHGTASITVTVEDGGDDDDLTTINDNASTTQTFLIIVLEALPYEGELPLAQNVHGQLHVGLNPVSLGQQPVSSNILGFQALGAEDDGSQKSLLVRRTNYLGEDVLYRLMTNSDWRIDDIFNALRIRTIVVLERPAIFEVSVGPGAYTIDLQRNPTLNVERGKTYLLNLNVAGHPFYLQTTTGRGYQPNDVYTSGFDGNGQVTGSYVWTVPLDAPEKLFYQCKFHSGMNGEILVAGIPAGSG